MRLSLISATTAILCISLSLVGCGGGGGGGEDFSGAANVSIRVQPSQIDSGDRALVEVSVGDVHERGIALKVRYPVGLSFVTNSGVLLIDDDETDIRPTVNRASDDDEIYLIFYLPQKLFRRPGEEYDGSPGTVQFQLAGKEAVSNGLVEVDADVDNPAADNETEFDLENPQFVAADQASISVIADE